MSLLRVVDGSLMGRTWPQTAPPPGIPGVDTPGSTSFCRSRSAETLGGLGRVPWAGVRSRRIWCPTERRESMRIRKQIQLSADGRVAASRLRSCQAAAAGARIAACRQGARDDECERADVCRLVCEVSVIRSVDRLLTTTYQFRSFVHSCLVAWGPPSVEAECDIVRRLVQGLSIAEIFRRTR